MKKNLITLSLCILLLFSLVNAQEFIELTDDFEVLSQQTIAVFQCAPASTSLLVQNTGDVESIYDVSIVGELAQSTIILPKQFSLKPGESQELSELINVHCDAKNSKLNIFIKSDYNTKKKIVQDIEAFKPNNIQVQTEANIVSINACQKATFSLKLFNLINFVETYSLSISDFQDSAVINPSKITLNPGKSANVTLVVEHKNCNERGILPFKLNIETEKTKLTGEIDLSLKLVNEYNVEILADDVKTDTVEFNHSILLKNNGEKKSTIELKLKSPEWVKLEERSVKLEPGESKKVNILINAKETQEDKYDVEIVAILLENAEKSPKKSFIITIRKLSLLGKYANYFVGGSLLVFSTLLFILTKFINYLRKNKKKNKKQKLISGKKSKLKSVFKKLFWTTFLIIAVLAAAWSIYNYQSELLKYKTQTIAASIVLAIVCTIISLLSMFLSRRKKSLENVENEIVKDSKKEFSQIDAWDKKEQPSQSKVENKKLQKKEIVSIEKNSSKWLWLLFLIIISGCAIAVWYNQWLIPLAKQNIWSYQKYFVASLTVLITALLALIMHKTNTKKKAWKIITARDEHSFSVGWNTVHHLSFRLVKTLKKFKIFIKKGKKERFHISPGKHIYSYFNIKMSAYEDEVDELTLHLKAKKSWLKQLNIDLHVSRFEHGEWKHVSVEQVNEDDKFAYFKAKTYACGQFAVFGKEKQVAESVEEKSIEKSSDQAKEKASKKPLIILGVLFSISFILVLYLVFTQQPLAEQKGIPPQTWEKNVMHKLDLNKYFEDPDKDKLEFSVNRVENIKIDFTEGVAFMIPDLDWIGTETAVFTANDGKDGIVSSNPVKLTVESSQWFILSKKYWVQLLTGLLLFLMIISLIIYRDPLLKFLDEQ